MIYTIPSFKCDENKVYYYSNGEKHSLAETVNITLTSVSKEESIVYAKINREKILRR